MAKVRPSGGGGDVDIRGKSSTKFRGIRASGARFVQGSPKYGQGLMQPNLGLRRERWYVVGLGLNRTALFIDVWDGDEV